MRALPLLLAFALALVLAPATLRALRARGQVKANYRGVELPLPLGVLLPAAALPALVALTLLERLAEVRILYRGLLPVTTFVLGVACLGLIDDLLGGGRGEAPAAPRGLRGHAAAALRGEPSTGVLKAAGTLGLALLATDFARLSTGRWLLAAALLALATHAFNLLDLRPGRTLKAFVTLGVGLGIGARDLRPLWAQGLFTGPMLVAGLYDLRERAMLGDTGAGAFGALAGLWLVAALSSTGQLIALALLLALAAYGELSSISALVDRVPLLRRLDSLGRPS